MPQYENLSLNMHFQVIFHDLKHGKDQHFQSVRGLKGGLQKIEGKTGREPYFENIVLRRAYQPNSELVLWCMNGINNSKKQPLDITIHLLNPEHKMICGWLIKGAVPLSWGVDELHAQDAQVLMETIELSYEYFDVINSEGKNVAPKEKKT